MTKLTNLIRNKHIKYLLVILCMLGIFGMSHLDAVKSWYMTGKVLTTVTQTQEAVEEMDFKEEISYYSADEQDFSMHLIRKTAHVIEFFTLFMLWVNALYPGERKSGISSKKVILLAGIFTVLYAIFDEVHQLFIDGRTGTVSDVLIDSIGIVVGLMVIKLWTSWKDRQKVLC